MSQAELQEDVQRAATTFMDRVTQSSDLLTQDGRSKDEESALLRSVLRYNASVIDIATGPFPEVNALDMLVFAMLCRGALERHWIPRCFGEGGKPLVEAFALLEEALWEIVGKILDRKQQRELRELVASWQTNHPDQYRVEGVRFQEFSEHAGEIENEKSRKARGLLGQVKSATRSADQAILISERAFFVAHRMPFLIRMQGRLGVQEVLSDSLSRLDEVEKLLQRVRTLHPMLEDVVRVAKSTEATLHETRELISVVEPHLHRFAAGDASTKKLDLGQTLASLEALADRSLSLVRELRGALPDDPAQSIAALEHRLDRVVRRWIVYVLMAALAWTVFFWCAYFLVRRL